MANNPVKPSYHGIVKNTRDALLLFQSAHVGMIPFIERRPTDRDRAELIASGNVFIYCETRSNIKRWTDGIYWSPSRIMSNFLIYREIDKRFGDDKTKAKTAKPAHRRRSNSPIHADATGLTREKERQLVGSLVDSYDFKAGGLVKKTISVNWGKTKYHLVSYYTIEDGANDRLQSPSNDAELMCMTIHRDFIEHSTWRIEIDENGHEIARDGSVYRNGDGQSNYHNSHNAYGNAAHDDATHSVIDHQLIASDSNEYHVSPNASHNYVYTQQQQQQQPPPQHMDIAAYSRHHRALDYSRSPNQLFPFGSQISSQINPPSLRHQQAFAPSYDHNNEYTSNYELQPVRSNRAHETQPRTLFPDGTMPDISVSDRNRPSYPISLPNPYSIEATRQSMHSPLPPPIPSQPAQLVYAHGMSRPNSSSSNPHQGGWNDDTDVALDNLYKNMPM